MPSSEAASSAKPLQRNLRIMRPLTESGDSILVPRWFDEDAVQTNARRCSDSPAACSSGIESTSAICRGGAPQDPYRIWISEIMLQQTRVAAVIPYYERFLGFVPGRFRAGVGPRARPAGGVGRIGILLARAQLTEGRAHHCRIGAISGGLFGAARIAGVGDYTAAAVASIAFGMPHAVLDGNVLRVLSRLVAERGDIKSQVVRRRLAALAETLLDRRRPGEFNQALMELGATVCRAQAATVRRLPGPPALRGATAGSSKISCR